MAEYMGPILQHYAPCSCSKAIWTVKISPLPPAPTHFIFLNRIGMFTPDQRYKNWALFSNKSITVAYLFSAEWQCWTKAALENELHFILKRWGESKTGQAFCSVLNGQLLFDSFFRKAQVQ